MNHELYENWLRRVHIEVPADFTDRVMDAVRREQSPFPKRAPNGRFFSPALRVAACAAACIACLFRMAAVFAFLFAQ